MALNYDPGAADDAIVAVLRANAGVQALVSQDENHGIHWAVAAYGNDAPFMVVSVASDNTAFFLAATDQMPVISYLVRAVAQTAAEANAIAKAADVALNYTLPTVAGFTTLHLQREGGGQRYADGDGLYNVAAYYKLTLHQRP